MAVGEAVEMELPESQVAAELHQRVYDAVQVPGDPFGMRFGPDGLAVVNHDQRRF